MAYKVMSRLIGLKKDKNSSVFEIRTLPNFVTQQSSRGVLSNKTMICTSQRKYTRGEDMSHTVKKLKEALYNLKHPKAANQGGINYKEV